ncbi:amino acid racemase [Candidatus Gottesmanbacteria bacterium]|nr:amino acid racemase [Candidatus Gottesmanbacteria bacterium]
MNLKKLQEKPHKHIGIVAVTAPGAALCYQTIISESEKILGERRHPEITLTHPTFDTIYQAQVKKDWHSVASILLGSIQKLASVGVQFAVIPANSIHFAIKEIQENSPIPVINLLTIVADECNAKKYRRPLILGVGITMDDHLYDETLLKQKVTPTYPNDRERKRINEIIYSELVKGICEEDSTKEILGIMAQYKRKGADAVILACTELPLIITDHSSPLPIIDTTRLLACSAVDFSL